MGLPLSQKKKRLLLIFILHHLSTTSTVIHVIGQYTTALQKWTLFFEPLMAMRKCTIAQMR